MSIRQAVVAHFKRDVWYSEKEGDPSVTEIRAVPLMCPRDLHGVDDAYFVELYEEDGVVKGKIFSYCFNEHQVFHIGTNADLVQWLEDNYAQEDINGGLTPRDVQPVVEAMCTEAASMTNNMEECIARVAVWVDVLFEGDDVPVWLTEQVVLCSVQALHGWNVQRAEQMLQSLASGDAA